MNREYTPQFVFITIHSVIIVYTILITATILKSNGYPEVDYFAGPIAKFVRNFGLFLILIPALWAVLTIWLDREGWRHSRIFTLVSGLIIVVFLFQLAGCSAAQAEGRERHIKTTQLNTILSQSSSIVLLVSTGMANKLLSIQKCDQIDDFRMRIFDFEVSMRDITELSLAIERQRKLLPSTIAIHQSSMICSWVA